MDRDDFGDRMKRYEAELSEQRLVPFKPLYVRLDGRSFSGFTKGFRKPYDPKLSWAMKVTAEELMKQFKPTMAFTQSDEISLGWPAYPRFPLFDGKIQKLTSTFAAVATSRFVLAMHQLGGEYSQRAKSKVPSFDARLVQLPSHDELANAFYWRELDCRRNAISSAAQSMFSHKSLQGKDQAAMREMMYWAGTPFDTHFPEFFRRGVYLHRALREVDVKQESLLNPNFRAPTETVIRGRIVRISAPNSHQERVDLLTQVDGFFSLLTKAQKEQIL